VCASWQESGWVLAVYIRHVCHVCKLTSGADVNVFVSASPDGRFHSYHVHKGACQKVLETAIRCERHRRLAERLYERIAFERVSDSPESRIETCIRLAVKFDKIWMELDSETEKE